MLDVEVFLVTLKSWKNYTRHALGNSDLVSSVICKSISFIRNLSKIPQTSTPKETYRCEKMANSYHATKLYRKNDKIFVPWRKKTGCGLDSSGSGQVPFARCLEKPSASQKGLYHFCTFKRVS